jgi:hypothetical protein
VSTTPPGFDDLTISCRIMIGSQPATETKVFEYGGAWFSIVAEEAAPDPDAAGFTINGNINATGHLIYTVEGETIFARNTEYELMLTHDPGFGDLVLYVDGALEAAATVPIGDRIRDQMRMTLPAGSWITDAAAWEIILVAPPVAVGPIPEITALSPLMYHTLDAVASGLFHDYGSIGRDMRDFNTASGTAANLTVESQHPFTAVRLNSSTGDVLTTQAVSGNFGVPGAMTWSVFAKFANTFPQAGHMTLSAHGNAPLTLTNRKHWFYVNVNGGMVFELMGPGETRQTYTSANGTVPNDGDWHLLSAVFNPSASFRFYVDGVQAFSSTTSIPGSTNDPSMQTSWGGLSNSNTAANMSQPPLFPFNGWLAHGFIENSAVTAATLLAIHDAVLP